MHTGPLRAASLALVLLTGSACRASGRTSFLLFGGPTSPQQELVERVRGARSEAQDAKEDFADAFQIYRRLTTPQAVDLEELSEDFEDALESCEERSREIDERIERVHKEADALFQGWSDELARFSSDTLRRKSEAMLQETRARVQRVTTALQRVKGRKEPVMQKLRDYALFFHHNLNARAIATLEDTYKDFDAEFRALNAELDTMRSEVDAFLAAFEERVPAQ